MFVLYIYCWICVSLLTPLPPLPLPLIPLSLLPLSLLPSPPTLVPPFPSDLSHGGAISSVQISRLLLNPSGKMIGLGK